jgi:hypothetical protein
MHLSALAPLASNAGNGHPELGAQNAGMVMIAIGLIGSRAAEVAGS